MSSALVAVLSQMNPTHILITHFNIILAITAWSIAPLVKLIFFELFKKFPDLWKSEVHCRVDRSPPLDTILGQFNPVHTQTLFL
jgi:hypothetical protein